MTRLRFLLCAALALGCQTKSLSNYKTNQIVANLAATGTSDTNTHVTAELHDSSSSLVYLQLTADDQFKAIHGTASQAMGETSLLGFVDYETDFNTSDSADIVIGLSRKVDNGAPHTVIDLPLSFTLTALSSSSVSRASSTNISWTGAASQDPMTVAITGNCLQSFNANVPGGATSFAVTAGSVQKRIPSGDAGVPDSCDATLTVTRSNTGTLDPGYGGGTAIGRQQRHLGFTSTP